VASGSRAVVVAGDAFARTYRKEGTVAPSRLHVVPNWVEENPPDRHFPQPAFRTFLGIPAGAFLALYGGNIGRAAGVETLIDAFAQLRQHADLHLVVGGEGPNLEHCRMKAQDHGCARVTFHSPWPEQQTTALMEAADLLIVPTQGRQSMASVPSKLACCMLAGRPILALALEESDLAHAVRKAGCGWVVPPDRPELLAAKIIEVSRMNPSVRQQHGENGRSFARANLARNTCLPRLIAILEETAAALTVEESRAPAQPELKHS
jgi:colanic acid biosynthesis glycosyl transferase WcaI